MDASEDDAHHAKVLKVFKTCDLDGNGLIDLREFEEVLTTLEPRYWTKQRIDGLFKAIDAGSDGLIQFEEMLNWLYEKPSHRLFKLARDPTEPAEAEEEDDWGDDAEDADPKGGAMPKPIVELEAAPSMDVTDECETNVVVSIHVPEHNSGMRIPADICCVVDISGSMGSEATYESDGEVRSDRLSYLDITKHAVKTVMHMLKDNDRLALVAFDDKAELVSPLLPMTGDGRAQAIAALDSLRPRGQTNLWAGILAGLEALCDSSAARRSKTLLVLTDGQPNEVPPAGHLTELRNYKESHPAFNFQMNTFGFGYSLDSDLLLDLAVEGHGTYAFIPDAVIVGTVFVNSVANVLSNFAQNATLHLNAQGGAQLGDSVPGFSEHEVTDASWGRVVELGPLQYGQDRDIAVPMRVPSGKAVYLSVTLTYRLPGAADQPILASIRVAGRQASAAAAASSLRSDLVRTGQQAILEAAAGDSAAAQAGMEALVEKITAAAPDTRVVAIKADAEGRMAKAVNGEERFHRWGKHYLRALVRAHHLQLCTNFMDPGLQIYGGGLYRGIREEGDKIFVGLPAPRPAADETAIPCDICGAMTPFSQYAEHVEACANPRRRAARGAGAAPAPAARPRSPSPDMERYYAGGGGG